MSEELDHMQDIDGRDGKVTVTFDGNIAVLTMDCGQNRFNKLFIMRMNAALDQVLE